MLMFSLHTLDPRDAALLGQVVKQSILCSPINVSVFEEMNFPTIVQDPFLFRVSNSDCLKFSKIL